MHLPTVEEGEVVVSSWWYYEEGEKEEDTREDWRIADARDDPL